MKLLILLLVAAGCGVAVANTSVAPVLLLPGIPLQVTWSDTGYSYYQVYAKGLSPERAATTVIGFSWRFFTPGANARFGVTNTANGYQYSWFTSQDAMATVVPLFGPPVSQLEGPWLLNVTSLQVVDAELTAVLIDWSQYQVSLNGSVTSPMVIHHTTGMPSARFFFQVPYSYNHACPTVTATFNGPSSAVTLQVQTWDTWTQWRTSSQSNTVHFTMPCSPLIGNNAGMWLGELTVGNVMPSTPVLSNVTFTLQDSGAWATMHTLTNGQQLPISSVVTEIFEISLPEDFKVAAAVVSALQGVNCHVYVALDELPSQVYQGSMCSGANNQVAVSVAAPADGYQHRMFVAVSTTSNTGAWFGDVAPWGSIKAVIS